MQEWSEGEKQVKSRFVERERERKWRKYRERGGWWGEFVVVVCVIYRYLYIDNSICSGYYTICRTFVCVIYVYTCIVQEGNESSLPFFLFVHKCTCVYT